MGGIGSGIHRDRCALRTESLTVIAIDYLRRHALLTPGRSFELRCRRHGRVQSVHVSATPLGLALDYVLSINSERREEVAEMVRYDYSRTNFAGHRQWFLCPGCGKRCGKLYG